MKKKKSSKKIIVSIVVVLILAALAVFGYFQYQNWQKEKQKEANKEAYTKIQEEVVTEPEVEETQEGTPSNDISVDFASLQAMNPDIYAWIYIPDTVVSYPLVQSEGADQSYYLNYTVEKSYGLPGSIYTENWNKKDFTDFNTVIYGHEMKDGSMFGSLKSYRDTTFWESHPEIYIYTPEKKYTYRIFGAVIFSDAYIPDAYDFSTTEGMGQFLTDVQSTQNVNSHIFEDASLSPESHILTLSTCISDQPNNRYLVEAYLVNEE